MVIQGTRKEASGTDFKLQTSNSLRPTLHAPRVALTIAATDSSGGAGIAADLRTFGAHGFHGIFVVTAVTAQSSSQVREVAPVSRAMIAQQFDALLGDFSAQAAKVGLLGSTDALEETARALRHHPIAHLVIDPVARGGDGTALAPEGFLDLLAAEILPLAELVTPNLQEAAELLHERVAENAEEMAQSAEWLCKQFGCRAALVKGGHLEGDQAVDVLYHAGTVREFAGERVRTPLRVRGTGCMLSAAIACNLAYQARMDRAVAEAKNYVLRRIIAAKHLGQGDVAIA